MKKTIYIILVSLAALSCGKAMDEISPKDKISANSLTDSDIALLTNGTLHQYEAFLSNLWTDGDFLAENYKSGPGFDYADPHGETQSPSASIPRSRWQYCFGKLNYANLLIKSALGSANQESSDTKTALGTGYFFRALIYYNLVQRFGGVPKVTTAGNQTIIPRSSEAEIWQMIKDDINAAEGYLQDFSSFAYPSKDACKILRAKVSLWTGDYANAIADAGAVISSKRYSLSTSDKEFASMFINGTSSKEIIFAPINLRSTDYIRIFTSMNDTDGSFNYSPSDWCYNNLFSDRTFATGDQRKDPTLSKEDTKPVIKFPNGQGGQFIANPDASQSPIMCFRLADAYLIKAEGEWAEGNYSAAVGTMKEFMESRYQVLTMPASMTKNELEELILSENRREFYAEGHRWFDVKRIGQKHHSADFSSWINTQYDEWEGRDFLIYWPIPQVERDKAAGAYTQNPGYSGYVQQ